MPRKAPCCAGERSLDGDPQGMHSMDCPAYLANVEAYEERERKAGRRTVPTWPPALRWPAPAKPTLLYAWNTRWCPTCGSRYFAEDAECCGQPCLPVRLEMHSRESG